MNESRSNVAQSAYYAFTGAPLSASLRLLAGCSLKELHLRERLRVWTDVQLDTGVLLSVHGLATRVRAADACVRTPFALHLAPRPAGGPQGLLLRPILFFMPSAGVGGGDAGVF